MQNLTLQSRIQDPDPKYFENAGSDPYIMYADPQPWFKES